MQISNFQITANNESQENAPQKCSSCADKDDIIKKQRSIIGKFIKREKSLIKRLSDKDRSNKNLKQALRNSKHKVEKLMKNMQDYAKIQKTWSKV